MMSQFPVRKTRRPRHLADRYLRISGKGSRHYWINSHGAIYASVCVASVRPSYQGTYIYLQVHFFSHLTVAKIISSQSMYELLRSFTTVLDEFGVSHGRAKQAALCAAEGLMMVMYPPLNEYAPLIVCRRQAGAAIKEGPDLNIFELMNSIQAYIETTADVKGLVQPTVKLFANSEPVEAADEVRCGYHCFTSG